MFEEKKSSVAEYLSEWMQYEYKGDANKFLKGTFLTGALTSDELRQLATGKKVPNLELLYYLATCLPIQVGQYREMANMGRIAFSDESDEARIIAPSAEKLCAAREAHLLAQQKAYLAKNQSGDPKKTALFHAQIIAFLRQCAGKTHETLGIETGLNKKTISSFENTMSQPPRTYNTLRQALMKDTPLLAELMPEMEEVKTSVGRSVSPYKQAVADIDESLATPEEKRLAAIACLKKYCVQHPETDSKVVVRFALEYLEQLSPELPKQRVLIGRILETPSRLIAHASPEVGAALIDFMENVEYLSRDQDLLMLKMLHAGRTATLPAQQQALAIHYAIEHVPGNRACLGVVSRFIREIHQLEQSALAANVGYTSSVIGSFETGVGQTAECYKRISNFLGVAAEVAAALRECGEVCDIASMPEQRKPTHKITDCQQDGPLQDKSLVNASEVIKE